MSLQVFLVSLCALASTNALSLSVADGGGNQSSPLLYGILYEDIYHSGDGGLYGELIQNRAFQGTQNGFGEYGTASLTPTIAFWNPIGSGVTLSIDNSAPILSTELAWQMRVDIPVGTTGSVGFSNDGYYGFDVDSSKRYIASMFFRGDYDGQVDVAFASVASSTQFSSASMGINQVANQGWIQTYSNVFMPTTSASDANNTISFLFDGSQLAGKSIYVNLISAFKQTYQNRINGMREDLAATVASMNGKYLRFPGGNNLEGNGAPYFLNWTQTVGPLTNRPGYPGTWGSTQTNGFGLLEQMQWAQDMGLTHILAVWAGLYLDGTIIPENELQSYVQLALDELEFLTGDASTPMGQLRAAYGYPDPFNIEYVEIGNEDFLNNGQDSYTSYRFNAFYQALSSAYPNIKFISTVNFFPDIDGVAIDLHIYGNEDYFVSLFDAFDLKDRRYPLLIGEYAAINPGNQNAGQVGAQTLGMSMAEAIFLLGCERNSDVVFGTSYGAFIKSYNEAPDTVAVLKQTANEVLRSISYYVQQLLSTYHGSETVSVTATDGNFGPVYWSATKDGSTTMLKLVNYNGEASTIPVTIQGSVARCATLVTLTAPSASSVNNLPELGGEASTISEQRIIAVQPGVFNVSLDSPYELAILVVDS